MEKSKTREELVKMYVDSLKENIIPWRKRWLTSAHINGITNQQYRGINQLILSFVAYKEHYNDNRWLTYVQIKDKGYKLNNSKGKGIPIEFWSVYDIKNKKKINFDEYQKIISTNPEESQNYKMFCNTSYVFNASLIEGIPPINQDLKKEKIPTNTFIKNVIKNLKVGYREEGNDAYYDPSKDEITIPESNKFFDEYSYYATQLHEICHSTGNKNRLDRNLLNHDKQEYAKEELIAEISSSFLMQKLQIEPKSEDYNNHKSYIQSWLQILEDKPAELFKAINESNKVYDYVEQNSRNKNKEMER
jgi:antirestriction protein ArdC